MTSEAMNRYRRNTALAAVIGAVLASYAGRAAAVEFQYDNGVKLNWNTTVSFGSSWRAQAPSPELYTRADGSLIGLYSGTPMMPGQPVPRGDGLAGNQAAGDGDLNYAKGDAFSQPFKIISDIEIKKDKMGLLVRAKAWYDYALENNKVLVGSQANNFNGTRPGVGPIPGYGPCVSAGQSNCFPISPPGQDLWPKQKLSDAGFALQQKFKGVMLLDAYVYDSFKVGNTDLQLRLGNQVINWGESIFIQGVNQINPIDVPAARQPGAEIKEILLPVPLFYVNWGLPYGSLEGFYQLQWQPTVVDGCGNYWTASGTLISSTPHACASATVLGGITGNPAPGTVSPIIPQLGSQPVLQATGIYVPDGPGQDASNSGQFGFAYHFPVDKLDTEFGLYAENIHSRLPYFSVKSGSNPANPNDPSHPYQGLLTALGYFNTDAWGSYWSAPGSPLRFRSIIPAIAAPLNAAVPGLSLKAGSAFWGYPEDIHIFGVSAATTLLGWSTSAEYSYTKDLPVQINGNDFTAAGIYGIGPEANRVKAALQKEAGAVLNGFDRFDKQQFQINTLKTFSNILGSDNLLLIGEVATQWNNIPDYTKGGIRYGRGFMYGNGSGMDYGPGDGMAAQAQLGLGALTQGNLCSPTFVGAPVPIANPLYNSQPNGCKNQGYVTDFSWGYRLRASADYNNVLNTGVTVTPSVYWAHDVKGVSMDPTFNEGRRALGLGVKFSYAKKYTLGLDYVTYHDGGFDPLFDRDYYSASVAVTF